MGRLKTIGAARKGLVFLVGAGPGRPDLLTLRGADCLARADAVVVDALVDRRVLEHAPPGVTVHDAGKRGHGRVMMKQAAINRLLVRLARAGKTVVRLKGGDPYFFGRGGEEAEALARARVPFEVVPGVSSVAAVPAYAGVPVTHRGRASTVTVVTGHPGRENKYLRESRREYLARRAPAVAWDRLDPRDTLVVLMGLKALPDIARKLLAAGWPPGTPAAVVQWGTLPAQRTVTGVVADIASRVREAGLGAPAVIIFGGVVGLRPRLNWFERLPLFGRAVMVTRAAGQASELSRRLEALGARVIECPAIDIRPLPLTAEGRRLLRSLADFDDVLFTSANAAGLFARHWRSLGGRVWPRGAAVLAVGEKTAQACRRARLPVHGVAVEAVAEGLLPLIGAPAGRRVLLPRAREGRDVLVRALERAGARVTLWPLYETVRLPLPRDARAALAAGRLDAVTFTSSSTVDAVLAGLRPGARAGIFRKTVAASIGPITSRALRARGVRVRVQPARATVEDLAEALARTFKKRGHRR